RAAYRRALRYCHGAPRELHSFPTRRSSDLARTSLMSWSGRNRTVRLGTGRSVVRTTTGTASLHPLGVHVMRLTPAPSHALRQRQDRKSTRLNSSHVKISYAVFCLKKKTKKN